MLKTIGSVGMIVTTFFVTLILNTAVNYYARDKGTVSISEPVPIGNIESRVVTIENYSSETLDGLVLEVPKSVEVAAITTKPAMSVEAIPSVANGNTRLLKVSQIHPRYVSRIFIAIPIGEANSVVRVSNLESSGLTSRYDDRLESPLKFALYAAFLVAFLYAIVEAISLYIASKEREKLHEKIDNLRRDSSQEIKQLERRSELMDKKADRLGTLLTKQRLLLQARMFDYSKELSFWRNSVRSLLLQRGGTTQGADELFRQVTDSLNTFGTKAKDEHSYENLKVAIRWLSEAEKSEDHSEEKSQNDG